MASLDRFYCIFCVIVQVDHLQLQLDQQRVGLQKSLAETEAMMRRNREDYEEKIESFRVNHQKEVQRILAQQALEHSASRLAEMQSKLDTQEVGVNSCLNVFNLICTHGEVILRAVPVIHITYPRKGIFYLLNLDVSLENVILKHYNHFW